MSIRRRDLARGAILAPLAWLSSGAETPPPALKLPTTPEDHFALAKRYRAKAEEYRREAREHREMAAAYRRNAVVAKGTSRRNPVVVKMEKHCAAIAAKAEALAAENERAADYHELRAKELQGK